MAMILRTPGVRRIRRVVRKRAGKGMVEWMGRHKGRVWQCRKGSGKGRETVMGRIVLNKAQ